MIMIYVMFYIVAFLNGCMNLLYAIYIYIYINHYEPVIFEQSNSNCFGALLIWMDAVKGSLNFSLIPRLSTHIKWVPSFFKSTITPRGAFNELNAGFCEVFSNRLHIFILQIVAQQPDRAPNSLP